MSLSAQGRPWAPCFALGSVANMLAHWACGCGTTFVSPFFGGPLLDTKVCTLHGRCPDTMTELVRSILLEARVSKTSELVEFKPWHTPVKLA